MTARSLGSALVVAVMCMGCAGPGVRQPDTSSPPRDPTTAELEAIFWARADSARLRFTEADVRFVTGMIGHHAQAVVMAGLAPSRGAGPAVSTLAARIINAQNDEIALMELWLRDRGQRVPEVEVSGITMVVRGADYSVHMPGMLTQEQLQELDAANGQDFDRVFLTYMIQHHEGAVTMVLELFGTDGAGQDDLVFKLASDIHVDQITEIARMKQMLQPRNHS